MALLAFTTFSGVAPRLTPWRLPPQMAQVALNVDLASRTLRPWKALSSAIESGLANTGNASTIYRFGLDLVSDTQYWFHWNALDVDLVKGPLRNDQTERTFYTGDGAPKWTNNTLALTGSPPYPIAYRDLGVVAPTSGATATRGGTGTGEEEDRVYVYTNVTAYGEESAPSPVSNEVTVHVEGESVSVTGFQAAPTGNSSTTARRLYRSVTSGGNPNYYFVKEEAVGVSTIIDDVGDGIGEPIMTSDWAVPPSDMFGITAMANGVLVGFRGNDVCISEAYIPYAWPTAYRLSTDYPIVGGKAIGNQTVVLTTGNPYLLSGTSPESMTLTKLEWPQSCVSKRSIVNVGGAVLFASPDGLCAIDGNGVLTNVTESLFTRDDWQAINPESINAYVHNSRYLAFYNTGVVQGGFVFEPKEGDAAFSYIDTYATAGYADLLQDELFLKVGTNIVKWNSSGILDDYDWLSGVQTLPEPVNMGAAQVRAEAYPVTFMLYGDGTLRHTEVVADNKPFRLPSGYKAAQYEVEVTGSNQVYEVLVAGTMLELKGK